MIIKRNKNSFPKKIFLLTVFISIFGITFFNMTEKQSLASYFDDIQKKSFDLQVNPNHLSFDLTAFILKPSGWDEESVLEQLSISSKILNQCNVEIRKAHLIFARPKNQMTDFEMLSTEELIKALPKNIRPIIVFFRYSKDPEMAGWAYWNKGIPKNRESDIAFISDEVITKSYKASRDETYNATAHELVHILGQMMHTPAGEKNLMAGNQFEKNSFLNEDQCDQIRSNKLIAR